MVTLIINGYKGSVVIKVILQSKIIPALSLPRTIAHISKAVDDNYKSLAALPGEFF